MKRRHVAHACAAAVLALAGCAQAVAGPVLERIRSSGAITLAYREASVPFSYLDAEGRPIGYAIDLCLRLAQAVQEHLRMPALEVRYLLVTSATRVETMAQGLADLECESTTNNAQRRQSVAFTVPHYITGARMLVRADSTLSELRAFTGKKVASTTGTTPLHMIRRADRTHLHRLEIVEVRDHAVGVDMVARGEVDAFVMDEVLLYGLIAAHPDAERLKVVGRYITIEPLAIMLPPDDPDFKAVVDQGMKQLIRSQEAHRLHDRWFVEKIPPLDRSLNLPMNDLLKAFWKFPTDWVPN